MRLTSMLCTRCVRCNNLNMKFTSLSDYSWSLWKYWLEGKEMIWLYVYNITRSISKLSTRRSLSLILWNFSVLHCEKDYESSSAAAKQHLNLNVFLSCSTLSCRLYSKISFSESIHARTTLKVQQHRYSSDLCLYISLTTEDKRPFSRVGGVTMKFSSANSSLFSVKWFYKVNLVSCCTVPETHL